MKKHHKSWKITKIVSIFFMIFSLGYMMPSSSADMQDLDVDKGDMLIYRIVSEIQDEDGEIEIFNHYSNENVKIKRIVTEESEIVVEKEIGMKYGFPLEVGLSWGQDAEDAPREDNAYKYFVEKREDVEVPVGMFRDCFKIVYITGPDTTEEWYYPGVGIIKRTYHHHGAILNETVELERIIKSSD
jgi:hypothetical protein